MTHGRELKRSQKTGEHEPQPTVVPARNQHGHSRMGVRRAGTVTVAWVCAWLWLVECSCERTLPALSARTLLTQRRRLLAATPQPAAGLEARLFVQRLVDGLPESVRQPTATCFAAASKGTTAVLTATQIDVKEFFDSLPEGARTPTVNCVAAGLAGTAAVLAATPIERMKVGLQTWPGSTLSGVVSRIVRLGPPGFFTGLDAMLLANVPYSIVFYGCYQPVRNMVNEKSWGAAGSGDEQGMGPMCAAGVANIVGTTFFMPGELVRMRMMHDPSRYTSFCQAVPTIVREEGAQTLFRGYRATLLRDIPYAMISFSLFEYLRSCLSRRNRDGTVSFGESAACSFITALVASTSCIPLDVIKSTVMTSTGKVSIRASSVTLLRQGGWQIFFRGYLPFLAIALADWGTSMTIYTSVLEYYGGGTMGGCRNLSDDKTPSTTNGWNIQQSS